MCSWYKGSSVTEVVSYQVLIIFKKIMFCSNKLSNVTTTSILLFLQIYQHFDSLKRSNLKELTLCANDDEIEPKSRKFGPTVYTHFNTFTLCFLGHILRQWLEPNGWPTSHGSGAQVQYYKKSYDFQTLVLCLDTGSNHQTFMWITVAIKHTDLILSTQAS